MPFKETIQYQSQLLHYGLYTAGYHSRFCEDIPWHWHAEFEFGLVTGGAVIYRTDRHTFELREGDGIFVNSGTLHELHPVEKAGRARLQTQFFDREFLAGAAGSLLDIKYVVPVQEQPGMDAVPFYHEDAKSGAVLARLKSGAALCLNRGPFFELRLRSLVSELWEVIYQQAVQEAGGRAPASRQSDNERIKRMMQYVQDHFREKITVADIAASIPVSERECYRLFQTHIGITPTEYVLSLRIRNAQTLLADTDKSILEIAVETGFGTSSYFGKMFRQHHHLTPTQYRRLGRQGGRT